MSLKKELKNIIIIFLFIFPIMIDAASYSHSPIAVIGPLLVALSAFLSGLTGFTSSVRFRIILLIYSVGFLILTFKTGFYVTDLLIISIIIWSFITPYLVKLKHVFSILILLLLILTFAAAFYRIRVPLLPILYFPFYYFGCQLRTQKPVLNKWQAASCLISLSGASAVLYLIYKYCLRTDLLKGLLLTDKLYDINGAFIYMPLIAGSFIIACFSLLIPAGSLLRTSFSKNDFSAQWKSGGTAAAAILTLSYFLKDLKTGGLERKGLLLLIVSLYLILIYILKKAYKEDGSVIITGSDQVRPIRLTFQLMKTLLFVLFNFFAIASVEYVIRGFSLKQTLLFMKTEPFAYELILICSITLFLVSLLGPGIGSLIAFTGYLVFFLANFVKITFFKEPFYPWDIFLLKDALIISKGYIRPSVIIPAAFTLFALTAIAVIFRKKVLTLLKPSPRPVLAIFTAAFLLFNFQLLKTDSLAAANVTKGSADDNDMFTDNGIFLGEYLYIKDMAKNNNGKPKGYSRSSILHLQNKYVGTPVSTKTSLKPNVVVVMSESFWDPAKLKGLQFNREITNNLKKYENGTLISPRFGGGTANIEFELLTGLSTFFFSKGIIPYNVYIDRNIPGITRVFGNNGYSTIAIHPNNGDMYNRDKVYNYMGFDRFIDAGSFVYNRDRKGNHISDDVFIDRVISTLKEEKDKPAFIFGVSMQNHDPYTDDIKKYDERDVQIRSNLLDAGQLQILTNYTQGIHDADKALGKLIAAVKKLKRPTLVYYFGDHLPRLGVPRDILDVYKTLKYSDKVDLLTDIKMYETPLASWSNYKKMPRLATPVSPNQLALEIMKAAELDYPGYYDYLGTLAKSYPYLNNYLFDMDKLMKKPLIKDYYQLQYDILFGEQYVLKQEERKP